MVDDDDTPNSLVALSALGEPSRRALYDIVVAEGDWISRDQAAKRAGLERGTAAHHLDRLAADGLLEVDYQRLTGRDGPGAGRPAKLYRRSPKQIAISLPPRDYELAGRLLAAAADRSRSDGTTVLEALDVEATIEGHRLAELIRSRIDGASNDVADRQNAVVETLEEQGFEPVVRDGTVLLRNCPFHHLAQEHPDLICAMNLCMLGTATDEIGRTGLLVNLEPEEGHCCVRFHQSGQ